MLKSERNIFLMGGMGVGKTTLGKLLALQLGRQFVDTAELIEERTNVSIVNFF